MFFLTNFKCFVLFSKLAPVLPGNFVYKFVLALLQRKCPVNQVTFVLPSKISLVSERAELHLSCYLNSKLNICFQLAIQNKLSFSSCNKKRPCVARWQPCAKKSTHQWSDCKFTPLRPFLSFICPCCNMESENGKVVRLPLKISGNNGYFGVWPFKKLSVSSPGKLSMNPETTWNKPWTWWKMRPMKSCLKASSGFKSRKRWDSLKASWKLWDAMTSNFL